MEKRNPIKNTDKLFVYSLNHKFIETTTVQNYIKTRGTSLSSIKLAVHSYKDYGYIGEEFVSLAKINHFYTSEELIVMFNEWLKAHLEENIFKLINMNKIKVRQAKAPDNSPKSRPNKYKVANGKYVYSTFEPEYLSMALEYITNSLYTVKGNNNFESALIWKYSKCKLDIERAERIKKERGFTPDSESKSMFLNDYDTQSAIERFGKASIFDSDIEYNCIDDMNSIKQYESISIILKESIPALKVDFFIALLNEQIFTFDDKPSFKIGSVVRIYKEHLKLTKSELYHGVRISLSVIAHDIIDECWEKLCKYKADIIDLAANNYYKDIDDYTLEDLMN